MGQCKIPLAKELGHCTNPLACVTCGIGAKLTLLQWEMVDSRTDALTVVSLACRSDGAVEGYSAPFGRRAVGVEGKRRDNEGNA